VPANHKVSVAWQIVFTFISILNLWAFYRIRKLRKYVLYVTAPSLVLSIFLIWYYFFSRSPNEVSFRRSEGFTFGDPAVFWPITILSNVIAIALQGLSIYLVIIWSRQHNKQFDRPTTQTTGP